MRELALAAEYAAGRDVSVLGHLREPHEDLRVLFARLKSVTVKSRQELVRALGKRLEDYLLVLADDFDTLQFVLVDKEPRAASGPRFPRAWLSRGIAGTRGRTLIVNLPGPPGGVKAGLAPELAQQLASWTVAGAGELLHRSDLGPSLLRQNVTSPNGTTFAALQVLMAEDGLGKLMQEAVAAAAKRSRELAK